MKHLMVDIETLGTEPGAVILSISAVQFDLKTGKTGSKFNIFISLTDSINNGLDINHNTAMWWLDQDKEAQNKLLEGVKNGTKTSLMSALNSFNTFMLSTFGEDKDFEIWGNSNRFDLGLLEAAYKKVEIKPGWNFWNERDVRTLVSFAPQFKENTIFKGVKHNSIDDCMHQIEYCYKTYDYIMDHNNYEEDILP